MRFSFPKSKRLVSNRQFKAVLARKVRASNSLLTLYIAENDCGCARLGISVGKSCGKAVVRNRLKRLLREAFRTSPAQIPAGFDYLVIISPGWAGRRKSPNAKQDLKQITFQQIRDSLLTLVTAAVSKIK